MKLGERVERGSVYSENITFESASISSGIGETDG